jgi:outer membrane lipoprotein-sorting protein
MSVMASRPVLRWVVPGGVLVAVLGGGAIATTLAASAEASLPPRSPAQLLVDVQTARLDAVAGTVTEKADLGLPSLPDGIGGRDSGANLTTLITGSHTLRVWYSGPDKARVALLGTLGESDIIRNGKDVWIWSSSTKTAQHQVLSEKDAGTASGARKAPISPSMLPSTPQEAADQVLAQLDPTTNVSVDPARTVAGRPVYTLALTPKDTNSKVAKVTIGIDGTKHIPLQVQIFAKGYASPAFTIGFTDVSFNRPDAQRFAFTPPPGATVTQGDTMPSLPSAPRQAGEAPKTAVIGTGWTSVLVARMPQEQAPQQTPPVGQQKTRPRAGAVQGSQSLDAILGALPQVRGSWGSGRMFSGRLFSVLLTDDGRVLVGAVSGQQLTTAAADPAAALK